MGNKGSKKKCSCTGVSVNDSISSVKKCQSNSFLQVYAGKNCSGSTAASNTNGFGENMNDWGSGMNDKISSYKCTGGVTAYLDKNHNSCYKELNCDSSSTAIANLTCRNLNGKYEGGSC